MKIKVVKLDSVNELGKCNDGELEMVKRNGVLVNLGGWSVPF